MPRLGDLVHTESRFLAGDDLKPYAGNGVTLTIQGFTAENVGNDQKPDMKTCLHFAENIKPMVLNKTNLELLYMATGSTEEMDSNAVVGRQIVLWRDPTVQNMQGNIVGGVRIKPVQIGTGGQVVQQPAAPMPPAQPEQIPGNATAPGHPMVPGTAYAPPGYQTPPATGPAPWDEPAGPQPGQTPEQQLAAQEAAWTKQPHQTYQNPETGDPNKPFDDAIPGFENEK